VQIFNELCATDGQMDATYMLYTNARVQLGIHDSKFIIE
jgi:hypothetical protein